MACSRLLALALAGVVDVCQSISLRRAGRSNALTEEWIQNVSFVLPMDFTPLDNQSNFYWELQHPHHHTAVVTFAGKRHTEYLDGAVMLGMSVQKYLPDYVRAAVIIEGMTWPNQNLLKRAGWKLITVPNWDSEYCGEGCDQEFLGRWHDSFEKINVFRLPFKRVLFFDSDTYIFRHRVTYLTELKLPTVDHIAMAKDGCKDEYNSGVMFFKPDLEVFKAMLNMVTERRREQILDQNLINSYYQGKILEFPREYNCVDTVGIQPGQSKPCEHHCAKNAVVAHFTGHPKPTAPKRRLLELVRRPGAPALACMHTNFGSCAKWSEYYCDIRRYSKRLSPDLREQLKSTGTCCHPSMIYGKDKQTARKFGYETCQECPATLKMWAPDPNLTALAGVYVKTSLPSRKFNGGRPVYMNMDSDWRHAPVYLFFMQAHMAWALGADYRVDWAFAYSGMEAQCPRDTKYWSFHNGTGFVRRHFNIQGHRNSNRAPKDTNHIVYNIHTRKWQREKIVWEDGQLGAAATQEEVDAAKDEAENATADAAASAAEAAATDSDSDNGTTATWKDDDDDDSNGTANIDADDKETTDIDAPDKETAAASAKDEKFKDEEDDAPGGGEKDGDGVE